MVTLGFGWDFMKWVIFALFAEAVGKEFFHHIHTNEIEERKDDRGLDIPVCRDNSICGYLQANSHGINAQQRCACPLIGSKCPLVWDSFDGHSVTQGSDQYKYCGSAPVLEVCAPGFTAYTSRIVFSTKDDDILEKTDHVHCICPETHNHLLANQRFDAPDEETEAMHLTYICAPLETCRTGDVCKAVSVTAREFLVQRKCLCPTGLRCPTEASHSVTTTPWDKGQSHYVRCQQ